MTEHERAVVAEWRELGDNDTADRLAQFAADIDRLSPAARAYASAFMFGRPGAPKPIGILHA